MSLRGKSGKIAELGKLGEFFGYPTGSDGENSEGLSFVVAFCKVSALPSTDSLWFFGEVFADISKIRSG